MKTRLRRILNRVCLISLVALAGIKLNAAESVRYLWEIGKRDQNTAEFALAPDGFGHFKEDGLFVVGRSDARRDWPYVHPGPGDNWAGGRSHTFTILFGVKNASTNGDCTLQLDLADAQQHKPPVLQITVNGHEYRRKIAAGAGDESLFGKPAKGKPSKSEVTFPASLLRAGANEISITTVEGCWMLYDWLGLEAPKGIKLARLDAALACSLSSPRALVERQGQALQPLRVTMRYFGKETKASIKVNGREMKTLQLQPGTQTSELLLPAVTRETQMRVTVEIEGQTLASQKTTVKPVRKMTVYILPHSHTDIGYTAIQTDIEKKQVNNLLQGIEIARKTANYPEGARFVWNVEVLWAADLFLNRLSDAQRADFFDAVKKGQVSLNGMYLNELTGLCRPEELIQLFRYSTKLAEQCGVTIDSAMISDVPGYTWGTVPAMAQAGIKYFSTAPNYFDRIGDILVQWENKPFYWMSPSGKEKVLVWIPTKGYALSHIIGKLTPQYVEEYEAGLDRTRYPYDIAYLRWSGHGDNATPDPAICEFVKDWNGKYAWPKFVISSTSEAFSAFEKCYGNKLPKVRGDWTPYWEDGAGSSSLETAMNRASSDRLVQAQALWATFKPDTYPAKDVEAAWNNVLLYSEHTWGAWCSITEPERKETREQWAIKQSYATDACKQINSLYARACEAENPSNSSLEVFNSTSWPRTEVIYLSQADSLAGDKVMDNLGQLLPSQRMANGDLAVRVRDVHPLASRRITVLSGPAFSQDSVKVEGAVLDNGLLRVCVDEQTGAIKELRARGIEDNLVDTSSGEALNDYRYLIGDKLADLQRNGPVTISVKEKGPLVASLLIESDAPGCNKLTRELRLAAGADFVELINTVDKKRLLAADYKATSGKESVNFAFPFNVPGGQMWLDIPMGAIRPELDQMPSACKNWFTVGRWADVSNPGYGVTWVTLDAPLVEVGGITATLLNSQKDPAIWRHKVERAQKLYSWAMNNHWGTNYRAYQEGPTVFRFVLRPHRRPSAAEASRLAIGLSQPLIVRNAAPRPCEAVSRLRLSNDDVLITGFKPSDDGKALIVRLFGASGRNLNVNLAWTQPEPKQLWLSDTSEKPLKPLQGAVAVPAWDVVTLRAELQ